MESVVIDRSSSYARTRFGSVDGGLLISKSFNATRPSFLGRNNNSSLNANFTSSLVHQPPLLPLPLSFPSAGTRSAFSQHRRYKKLQPTTAAAAAAAAGAKNSSSCSKEPNNEPLVVDKLKRMEVVASSLVCSVSPPPSSVPMPSSQRRRYKKLRPTAAAAAAAAGAKNSNSCSKEPNNEPLVVDKLKRMEVVASSLVCSVSPPPSSVPMPRFSIPKGKAATATTTATATATTAVTTADGNSGHVDVCATDGLRRLLRI